MMSTSAPPSEPGWTCADRKSTRLNSSHSQISYAVFCLKKKMDELAQYYMVLPQLDLTNNIDHWPDAAAKWFLVNENEVTQLCRKLTTHRPLMHILDQNK